ncbi:MAG: hypothetical protein PHV55_00895 [Candidatus Omnitrophica bacterium]|nr:hypothetical protein [Candidatus Omnitrophota bacterium]
MKEIVEHILQEETEARNKLEAARLKAATIVAQAQKEAQTFMEEKISDVQCRVAKDMESFQEKYVREKDKILTTTKEEIGLLHQKHAHKSREIAQTIFRTLITTK